MSVLQMSMKVITEDLGGTKKVWSMLSYHMLEFQLDSNGSETVLKPGVNLDNRLNSRNSGLFQGQSVGTASAWQQSKAVRLFIDS